MPPVPKQFSGRGGKAVGDRPGGKELLLWSRQRFVKECGQQERVGNLMYAAHTHMHTRRCCAAGCMPAALR